MDLQVIDLKGIRVDQKKGNPPWIKANQAFERDSRKFPTEISTAFVHDCEKRLLGHDLMAELKVQPYVLGRLDAVHPFRIDPVRP